MDEVLVRGVLLESAEQVADGYLEIGRRHDRGVQQEPVPVVLDHPGMRRCHPFEHFELDPVIYPSLGGQQESERHVEEVVAGDADTNPPRPLPGEDPIEAALEVGVGLRLRAVGSLFPAADRRIHPLHGEVRPLYQANLHRAARTASDESGAPVVRPRLERLQRPEGVREVGLQHDAGIERMEFRLVQQCHERGHGELEIVVLLHVQVHEGWRRGGGGPREQGSEAVADPGHARVEIPVVELGSDGGNLDRDVVDVGLIEETQGLGMATSRLGLPENGLPRRFTLSRKPPRRRRLRCAASATGSESTTR